MNKLIFSYNWNNKLDGKRYTTLRLHNPKYKTGEIFEIFLGKRFKHKARIVEVRCMHLSELTEMQASLDTGYSRQETLKIIRTMYKNKSLNVDKEVFVLVLFEVLKEHELQEQKKLEMGKLGGIS